jgi:hypothetical protein
MVAGTLLRGRASPAHDRAHDRGVARTIQLDRSNGVFGGDYLGALATPIERAAFSYQGLDFNETLLTRFVEASLGFFADRPTEDF